MAASIIRCKAIITINTKCRVGAVAKRFKALLLGEKIYYNQKYLKHASPSLEKLFLHS